MLGAWTPRLRFAASFAGAFRALLPRERGRGCCQAALRALRGISRARLLFPGDAAGLAPGGGPVLVPAQRRRLPALTGEGCPGSKDAKQG